MLAAREEQRRDHVGIGGEGEPGAAHVQPGGVLELLELRIAERVEEHGLDQRLGRLAARAVGHRDALFEHLRPPAASTVDAVEHLLLAVDGHLMVVVDGHRLITFSASGTRWRFIRP